jgi:uncharacterized protein YjiS (DUF1127 family)
MSDNVLKVNLGYLGLSAGLRRPLEAGLVAIGRWRARNASLRVLGRLDDRALLDIGIDRHGLREVVDAHLR